MAPSNLNQVFVMNNAVLSNATQFNCHTGTTLYSALAASANKGGIWTRPIATGTPAYTSTALLTAATGSVAALGQTTDYFQVVQGTNKSLPIATPLISPKDVRRVKASVGLLLYVTHKSLHSGPLFLMQLLG